MKAASRNSVANPGAIYRYRVPAIAVALGLLSFLLYALTLAPGLTWSNSASDGGDLLTAAFTWGIPHPTGYPTYLLSLRGFSALFPFGDEPLHGNLYSAMAASAAVALLFVATVRILRLLSWPRTIADRHILIAAFLASISITVSPMLWSQATVTEVYALNALFVSAVLLAGLGLHARREGQTGDVGWQYGAGAGLLAGLAMGNHLTITAVIVPMYGWALIGSDLRSLRPRHVGPLAVGGLVGLSVYAYAPLASSQSPALNWGHPDTLQGFWWMVSGTVYQDYTFDVWGEELFRRVVTSTDFLFTQFAFLGVLLGLAGLTILWTRLRSIAIAHLAAMAVIVTYTVTYRTFDSFLYLIPVFMLFSIWMAAGILRVLGNLDDIPSSVNILRRVSSRTLSAAGIVIVLAAVPGFALATNYQRLDLSDDTVASDYADAAFAVLEPGSVVITRTQESVFSLWYQSYVAEPELNVMTVSAPHIVFDWYWNDLSEQFPERMPPGRPEGLQQRILSIIDYNLGINPIYEAGAPAEAFPELTLVEEGVLKRFEPG